MVPPSMASGCTLTGLPMASDAGLRISVCRCAARPGSVEGGKSAEMRAMSSLVGPPFLGSAEVIWYSKRRPGLRPGAPPPPSVVSRGEGSVDMLPCC